jgi:hypothetical protein
MDTTLRTAALGLACRTRTSVSLGPDKDRSSLTRFSIRLSGGRTPTSKARRLPAGRAQRAQELTCSLTERIPLPVKAELARRAGILVAARELLHAVLCGLEEAVT